MSEAKLRYKVPAQVGAAIDLLMKVREARKKIEAEAEAEKEQERLIKERIFALFKKSELEGARGKIAQASIKTIEVPTLKDWEAFEKHVLETRDLSLLQRRVSVEAVRERWNEGGTVPGVEVFTKIDLHLTKVKKR